MPSSKFSILAWLGLKADKFKQGLKDAVGDAKGMGGKMGGMLAKAGPAMAAGIAAGAAAAAAAVATFAKNSLAEFATFEKGMNEVFTLMPGISKKEMGKMQDDVLELSRTMGKLPEEIVPALYQAISAGVPKDNAMEFMQVASKAAIGGVATLEESVDVLTSVVNTYGKENITAQKAADILFTTVKLGKTNFSQLSATLYNVMPIANAMGVSFEQVGASMAALTAKGVPTAQATTQLRAAMQSLGAPTSRQAEFMRTLGIDTEELKETIAKKPDGLVQAMKMIGHAANGDKEKLRKLLGSVEAVQAVLALTADDAKVVTDNLNEMANASGASEEAFKTMDQGLARSMEKIKASIKAAMVKIGAALAPVVEAMMPALQDLADAFADLPWKELGEEMKKIFIDLKPALKELVKAGKELFHAFLPLIKLFLRGEFTKFKHLIDIVIVIVKVLVMLGKAIGLVVKLFTGLFGPTEKATDGVDKAAKATDRAYNAFSLLTDILDMAIKGWEMLEGLVDSFLRTIGPAQKKLWSLGTVFKKVRLIVLWFIDTALDRFEKLYAGVKDFFDGIREKIMGVVNGVRDFIKDKFGWLIAIVGKVRDFVIGAFRKMFPGVAKTFDKISSKAKASFEKVRSTAGNAAGWIKDKYKKLRGEVTDEMVKMSDDITETERAASEERARLVEAEQQRKIDAAKKANDDIAKDTEATVNKLGQTYADETKMMQATLIRLGAKTEDVLKMNGEQVREMFKKTGKQGEAVMEHFSAVNKKQIDAMKKALEKLGVEQKDLIGKSNEEIRKMWLESGEKGKQYYIQIMHAEAAAQRQRGAGAAEKKKDDDAARARAERYRHMSMEEIKKEEAARKKAEKAAAAAAEKGRKKIAAATRPVVQSSRMSEAAVKKLGPAIEKAVPPTERYAEAIVKAAHSEDNLAKRLAVQVQQGFIRMQNAAKYNMITTGTMKVMGVHLAQLRYAILYNHRMAQFADIYQKALSKAEAGGELKRLEAVAKILDKHGGAMSIDVIMKGVRFDKIIMSMDRSLKSIDHSLKGKFVNQ